MSYDTPISADEKRWRAESDARTLAEAERIKNDQPRLTEAQAAANRMADEEAEQARAMRKVAGRKKPGGSGPHNTGSRVGGKTSQKSNRSKGTTHNVFQRI